MCSWNKLNCNKPYRFLKHIDVSSIPWKLGTRSSSVPRTSQLPCLARNLQPNKLIPISGQVEGLLHVGKHLATKSQPGKCAEDVTFVSSITLNAPSQTGQTMITQRPYPTYIKGPSGINMTHSNIKPLMSCRHLKKDRKWPNPLNFSSIHILHITYLKYVESQLC